MIRRWVMVLGVFCLVFSGDAVSFCVAQTQMLWKSGNFLF